MLNSIETTTRNTLKTAIVGDSGCLVLSCLFCEETMRVQKTSVMRVGFESGGETVGRKWLKFKLCSGGQVRLRRVYKPDCDRVR